MRKVSAIPGSKRDIITKTAKTATMPYIRFFLNFVDKYIAEANAMYIKNKSHKNHRLAPGFRIKLARVCFSVPQSTPPQTPYCIWN